MNNEQQLQEEILALHRKLAGETLRADQGWQRYESANKRANAAEAKIAALSSQPQTDDKAGEQTICAPNCFWGDCPPCVEAGLRPTTRSAEAPVAQSHATHHEVRQMLYQGYSIGINHYGKPLLLKDGEYFATIDEIATALSVVHPARRKDLLQQVAQSVPEGWAKVSKVGNPKEEGLYLAIYRDGQSLPIALVSYGDYEFYSDDDPSADAEGMVQACGWHEETDDPTGEYSSRIYKRNVVAYQPFNLAGDALAELRAMLAAAPNKQEPAGNADKGGGNA